MSVVLEGPREVRGGRLAVLVRQEVVPHRTGRGVAFVAERRPVALLLRWQGETRAIDPSGGAMDLDEIERLCPGAISALADPG